MAKPEACKRNAHERKKRAKTAGKTDKHGRRRAENGRHR